jgi:hypothetical protein
MGSIRISQFDVLTKRDACPMKCISIEEVPREEYPLTLAQTGGRNRGRVKAI